MTINAGMISGILGITLLYGLLLHNAVQLVTYIVLWVKMGG
jgi:hypothetical protein